VRLILSGEGSTDIGVTRPLTAGLRFVPGPMAWFVDRLLEPWLGYSALDMYESGADCVRHVHETELAAAGRPGSPLLPGVRFGKGTALFTRNAQVLGLMARQDAEATGQPVIAVIFRDGDGTHAVPRLKWQQKFDSIARGFELVEFGSGVPMVPRPKSEAWLICALKAPPYQHCDVLEDSPGNDGSPNALKNRLAAIHGREPGADDQADWVRTGRIDPGAIDMPSCVAFREALDRAARAIGLGAAPGV
jgi:hypothetical protein